MQARGRQCIDYQPIRVKSIRGLFERVRRLFTRIRGLFARVTGEFMSQEEIWKHCGWLEYYQSKTRVSCILHRDTSKLKRDARKSNAPPGI